MATDSQNDKHFERVLNLYQKNIYALLAVKEASPLISTFVIAAQICIPLFVIIRNAEILRDPPQLDYDVVFVSTILLFLLWQLIVTDTRVSVDGFDLIGGFKNLPRPVFVSIGMLLTEIVNPLSGIAAFFLLLKTDTIEDAHSML